MIIEASGCVLEAYVCLVRQGGRWSMQVVKGRGDDGVCLECSRRRVRWKGWSTRVKPEGLFKTVRGFGWAKV